MEEIRFQVQGSAPEPYEVHFIKRSENNISAYCTCPAGDNGQYCKHRFNILAGLTDNIVSGNENQVKIIKSWLPGSDLESAMQKVEQLEKEFLKAKKALSAAKKKVAEAMRD